MRTAILLGCMFIGYAISGGVNFLGEKEGEFFGWVILACIVMDVVEYIVNVSKKK